jgi:hydrogenase nickel incorporation protein HypB
MKINVMSDILKANDLLANDIRKLLKEKKVVAFNMMGSPGSGKTSVLERLLPMLPVDIKAAVIEGDLATSKDAERIAKLGVQSTQINTGSACHLDAAMVRPAIDSLSLDGISILFIENVGNLVCPSGFDLGENWRIIVSSITEGDDKPEKYPVMYRSVNLVILNKIDLASGTNFNMEYFKRGMEKVNPAAEIIPVSALTGSGFDKLLEWTLKRLPQRA